MKTPIDLGRVRTQQSGFPPSLLENIPDTWKVELSMEKEEKYCVSCGELVPTNSIHRDDHLELTCVYCGFVLDVQKELPARSVNCIFTVDDSSFIRELISGLAVDKGLASKVISVENGQKFVEAFTKHLSANQAVGVVILDLELPVMNGLTAARVMRSIEEKFRVPKTPLIFFSSQKCDEALKKQLGFFSPATYLNKGVQDDPTQLIDRIDSLITYLLTQENTSPT